MFNLNEKIEITQIQAKSYKIVETNDAIYERNLKLFSVEWLWSK